MCVKNRTPLVIIAALIALTAGCSGFSHPGGALKTGSGGFKASPDIGGRVTPGKVHTGTVNTPSGPGSGVVRNGAHDASYFRHLIDEGQVPLPDEITVEGVFAESPHPDKTAP